jgi:hypothetical protein
VIRVVISKEVKNKEVSWSCSLKFLAWIGVLATSKVVGSCLNLFNYLISCLVSSLLLFSLSS